MKYNISVYDVIIIGAGASGLFAGVQSSDKLKTLIIEHKSKPGLKLLMSGAGRCNITNSKPIREFLPHYGDKQRFISPALLEFTNQDLLQLLHKNSIPTVVDKNGKVFPASQSASDVLALFIDLCRKNNVQIRYNEIINSIEKIGNQFHIKTNNSEFISTNLVIATGGKSYPSTGSTGDGYTIAKNFGHTIINPKPALAPIFINNFRFSELSGIALEDRKIDLYRAGRKIQSHCGDILFTHRGLSGPGILDFSRVFELNDTLHINLSNYDFNELNAKLIDSQNYEGALQIKTILKRFNLPERLIQIILINSGINPEQKIAEINKKSRLELLNNLTAYQFKIDQIGGFNIAMTTEGGINLKEINPKNMMSKLVPNLYFIGEVLDISAHTGGYSLQAAFSTANLAMKHIKNI